MTYDLIRRLFVLAALCAGCVGQDIDNNTGADAGELGPEADQGGDEPPATVIAPADAPPSGSRTGDAGDGDGDHVELGDGDPDKGGDGDGDAPVFNPCGGIGGFECECGGTCEHGAQCAQAEIDTTPPLYDYATIACPGPAAGGLVRYVLTEPYEGRDVWTWQCAGVNLLICKRSDGEGDGCTAARCPEGLCSGC